MSFRQEVKVTQISPQMQGEILQMLLDHCKLRLICKRQWLGAVATYELERTDIPPAIVKARVVDETSPLGDSHGSEEGQEGEKVPAQGSLRKRRGR